MTFEEFAADNPHQIALGLFNGELQAVYLLCETEPNIWDCHFTSRRGAPKDAVLSGARWVIDYFKENEMGLRAYVQCQNRPLQAFAEAAGLTPAGHKSFPCNLTGQSDTLQHEIEFVEYGG